MMRPAAPPSFGTRLKSLREAAGFTQEELATIAGLSVHAVSALERGERRRPQFETVRSLSTALDLTGPVRDALLASARTPLEASAVNELSSAPLPVPLTNLVGRDDDVATLRQWLTDPAARLVTLVGPGGVGKTRLALELARAIVQNGTARLLFVWLAAIRDPAFVASAISEAFRAGDVAASDLSRRIRAACDGHDVVLVLDNFEQVLGAAPLVADLVGSVPSLRVLVTSRAPLHVRGEREYLVSPLGLAPGSEASPAEDLARAPAVRLFVERVRDVQPEFRLTDSNSPTVAAICRRLDSLPLALELAAPWIKVLSAGALLNKLERDVLLTSAGPRDLPERQQTMNETVAWSYQLLDAAEQRAFRRFGALPGLFPVDAAAEVLAGCERASGNDALESIAALIDKSLLLRSESSVVATCPLYYMLETVHAYAAKELAATGERDDAMEGLVRYCTAEAAMAADGLVGPAQVEWLDRVREDLDSYRAALTWLIERERAGDASRIVWPLLFFWLIRGHASEGLRWYEDILNLPALPLAAAARMHLGAAAMLHTQGALRKAEAHLTRALDTVSTLQDRDIFPQAAWMCGHVEYAAGNLAAARDWFLRSRDGFRTLPIPWGVGSASSGLAWVALAMGDRNEAARLVDDATAALRLSGPWFLALGLYIRVVLALQRGNPDAVISLMRHSLARVLESQDRFGVVYGLVPLAAAAALKGDDAWVARILGTRDGITERTGCSLVDPMLRELGERTERVSRMRLGSERWTDAYAEGRKASIDRMLNDIDQALAQTSPLE